MVQNSLSKLNALLGKIKSFRLVKFRYFYIEKISYPLFLLKYRLFAKLQNKTIVHFLHIGKTGGTAIKNALKNQKKPFINDKYIIFSHPHFIGLHHVMKGERVFFFIRNPIDRFVSGFYSRKRKGMPNIYNEWNAEEAKAFNKFSTPNELAESLTSKNKKNRNIAYDALYNIGHLRTSYWDWFKNKALLQKHFDDIIFVGSQRNLNEDFEVLKKILGIPETYQLPTDKVNKHKNPENTDKHLSDKAIKNLEWWYEKDFYFLDLLNTRYKDSSTIDMNSNYGT
ncbi:MAG: sulfotransferase family 2 domain-containing protein [Bacteroidales bacterium]